MDSGVSKVEVDGNIVCSSVSSVAKGSVTGVLCSVLCFGRENNLGRCGSFARLRPCKKQNIMLCNRVSMNAIYVSQSLRVVVV